MEKIVKIDELKSILEQNSAVLLYFSADTCSVCEILSIKIEESLKNNFPLIKAFRIDNNLEISTQFTVFTNPTILVFFEGKEFKRYGRNISLNIFNEEIKRVYEMVF